MRWGTYRGFAGLILYALGFAPTGTAIMLLGIGVLVLLLGTVAYVAWLVHQGVATGSRMRRLEKRASRRARREDREDRHRRPVRPPTKPSEPAPPRSSNPPDRPRSSLNPPAVEADRRREEMPEEGIEPPRS